MRILMVVCILQAFFQTAIGWDTIFYVASGRACKINNVYAGSCKLRDNCENITNERNSEVESYSSDNAYAEKCAPQHVCCPYIRPTPMSYQNTWQISKPGLGEECRTDGFTGTCSLQSACYSMTFITHERYGSRICSPEYVCCLNTGTVHQTPSTGLSAKQILPGEKCDTAAGTTGSCTRKTSCNTMDYNIDMRSGDDKCTAEYVCCPNTNYQVQPLESQTVIPFSHTLSTGQLARPQERPLREDCRTVVGTKGSCTLRSYCRRLDYSIDIRYGGDKCTTEYVCCPNTNYHEPTTESTTSSWVLPARQPSTQKEKARLGEECNTIAGTKGSCTQRTSCNTLDYNINVRYGDDKCGPEFVCCPNTNYRMPTEESVTIGPVGRTPSVRQSTRVEGQQINKVCQTQHGNSGLCAFRQQCKHLYYASDFSALRDVCDVQHICCPVNYYVAVAPTMATSVPIRTPIAGDKCRTVAGTNGSCTLKSSCNTLDFNIDMRYGDDKCYPDYVCCPNTDYQMPTEGSYIQPTTSRKPLAGAIYKACRTQNRTSGLCSSRQHCRNLDYALDFSGYRDVCDAQHICCPVHNYAAVTTTPRPVTTTPRPVTAQKTRAGDKCRTVAGTNGSCTLKSSCNTLDYNIDMRYGDDKCYPDYVCCPNTDYQMPTEGSYIQPSKSRKPLVEPIYRRSGKNGFNCKAAGREDEGLQCGFRNSVAIQMLGVWSRPIEEHEFPFMVAILRREGIWGFRKWVYLCGGSLIHYRVVLTAAHCVNNQDRLKVRVGAFDLSRLEDSSQEAEPNNFIIHQDYTQDNPTNDVALIIMKKKFKATSSVGLICLPTPDLTVDSDSCVTPGWGNVRKQYGSALLRLETQPLVARDTCERQVENLHESFICAGGAPYGVMVNDDGGSPLVCTNGQRFFQCGIFLGVIKDGQDLPSIYIDVVKVVPWISEQMRTLGMKC